MKTLDEIDGFAFRTGRSDCASSSAPDTGDEREFPHPDMSGEEMFAYYARTDEGGPGFGFSKEEVGLI